MPPRILPKDGTQPSTLQASLVTVLCDNGFEDSTQNDPHGTNLINIKASWRFLGQGSTQQSNYSLIALDIDVEKHPFGGLGDDEVVKSPGLAEVVRFVQRCSSQSTFSLQTWRLLVIVPARSGYLIRSQCFQERLVGCDDLFTVLDRSVVGTRVEPCQCGDIARILDQGVLVLAIHPNMGATPEGEANIIEEIRARINFDWILDDPVEPKTLALVDGHLNLESYLGLYNSIKALGARIVLLDRADHWITAPRYRHLYDDYIAIDMTPDEAFHERIADAVRQHGSVDGICGIATYSLPPVARAAALLGLPTEPPAAVARANDKYETRQLEEEPVAAALVDDVEDLRARLADGSLLVEFPVVAKPTFGTGSAHVHKATAEAALEAVVERIAATTRRKVLVEAYVEGPELDINFVLLDGEILFFEMNDDFPSPGDVDVNGDANADFWESINVFPTVLPDTEFVLLRTELHRLLLRMGLTTGVFHLEARVQHSTMDYGVDKEGLYDLRLKPRDPEGAAPPPSPRCFLIEVNPRPPGMACCYATSATYGVNLYDLHALRMLNDRRRFRALARPFDPHSHIPYRGRLWTELFWLRADRAGRCASDAACTHVLDKLAPPHRALIRRSVCFFTRGQEIPPPVPGVVRLGGFIFLASRESREDVLRASKSLEKYISIPVEPLIGD